MAIDIAALVIVFVWAVFGYRKGFARQLFGLLAIVCVVLFSAPLAQIAEHVLADEADITMPGARMRIVLTSTCAAFIFISVSLVGAFLRHTLIKGIKPAEKTDHVLGMTLGIIESAIGIYVIMCVFAMARDKIDKYVPEAGVYLDQSAVYRTADDYNAVAESPFIAPKNKPKNNPKGTPKDDPSDSDAGAGADNAPKTSEV